MQHCAVRSNGFAPTGMPRIAIVAAMEREVEPLIRGWESRWVEHDGRKFKVFQKGETALVCGGIGPDAARRATEAMIRTHQPDQILSAGFAGGLDPVLRVGDVIEPSSVVNARDGSRIGTDQGAGILVTSTEIATAAHKRKLRDLYAANAVDMEAAAVAQGAEVRGLKFGALKVVSDEADWSLPPVEGFVSRDGSFRTAAFAFHVALRPWLWSSTIALARNSRKAGNALSSALAKYLDDIAADQPGAAGEK